MALKYERSVSDEIFTMYNIDPSVNWKRDGKLVCPIDQEISILDKRLNDVKIFSVKDDTLVIDVHELDDSYIVLNYSESSETYSIVEYDFDMNRLKLLCDYGGSTPTSRITINYSMKTIVAVTCTSIRLYSLKGELIKDVELSALGVRNARVAKILPGNHLLLLDKYLNLMRIKLDSEPEVVWRCGGMGSTYGFCVENNLIYVACYSEDAIKVVSLQG